jgi:hypothetical protein
LQIETQVFLQFLKHTCAYFIVSNSDHEGKITFLLADAPSAWVACAIKFQLLETPTVLDAALHASSPKTKTGEPKLASQFVPYATKLD